MSQTTTPQGILLIGFDGTTASRLASSLAEAGHRGRTAQGAREVSDLVREGQVQLALADLAGAFVEVLGGLDTVREVGRTKIPVLGMGEAAACAAITDALRGLGLRGLVPHTASPQELVFRVNRILFADAQAASRVSPRVPVNLPASFDALDGPGQGRILNVSETGIFLSTEQLLPVNRNVTVRFAVATGAEPLPVTCRVVWSNAGGEGQRYFKGMGLQFLEMRPAVREALQRFLYEALAALEPSVVAQQPASLNGHGTPHADGAYSPR